MITVKRGALPLFIGIVVLLAGAAVSYGNPADPGGSADIHATSAAALHEAVQGCSAEAAAAREAVTEVFDSRSAALQASGVGLEPAAIKARIAALSDSEIFTLQRQLMPQREREIPAGMEERHLIPILAGVSAGLAVGMFMFHY